MESAIFIGTPALFNVAMGALCIAGAVVAEIIPLLGVVPAAAGRPTGPVNSVAARSAGAVLDRTPGANGVADSAPAANGATPLSAAKPGNEEKAHAAPAAPNAPPAALNAIPAFSPPRSTAT
jgi:hypothetical protein